jgi:hypothetical protein
VSHPRIKIVLSFLLGLFAASLVRADIIVNSIGAINSPSDVLGPPPTSNAALETDSISQCVINTCNNFATADENNHWNSLALALTGTGLISDVHALGMGPEPTPLGVSSSTLVIGTATNANPLIGGTYGFPNDSLILPDSASRRLVGPPTRFPQFAIPKINPFPVVAVAFGLGCLVYLQRRTRQTAFATRRGYDRGAKSRADGAEVHLSPSFPEQFRPTTLRKLDRDKLTA